MLARRLVIAVALLSAVLLLLNASVAAVTLSIADTSVSETQTRDGRTLTLGYRITSDGATDAQLTATLVGPVSSNDTVIDTIPGGVTVHVTQGTHWYYRDYLINLGPGASQGSSKHYDVTYTLNWGSGQTTSLSRSNILTMQSPISIRIPILMYHKVYPISYSTYYVPTAEFRAQLAMLRAYGYETVTFDELRNARAGIETLPDKPIMLTFDDGYENFYTDAAPALREAGYNSVPFVPTGKIGGTNAWDTGDNNPVINHLTWDEVALLDEDPLVDVESHTVNHPSLTSVSSTQLKHELEDSRQTLMTTVGGDQFFFCYPYGAGASSTTVRKAVRSAGYFAAVAAGGGVEPNCADKFAWKRVGVYAGASVNYDTSQPGNFFPALIGESVATPSVSVTPTLFFDPAADTPVRELHWGQTVLVTLTAANNAGSVDATVCLALDNDSDTSNGVVFDSHKASPIADIALTGWTGERALRWLWTAPIDTPTGPYYAVVNFRDPLCVLSFRRGTTAGLSVQSGLAPLAAAKTLADNTWATFKGAVVTAAWPDCFYIETDDRATGLRVERIGHGITAGSRVDVAGQVSTNASGERRLVATIANVVGTGSIKPLALANRAVGGGASGHQDTVGGAGLNNTGLLVRVWGRVRSIDTGGRVLVIDDGSGIDLKCAWGNGVTVDPGWTFVKLTGISSCEKMPDGSLRRLLLIASADGS